MTARALVVAIDGPSGSGKSSVSRAVAAQLGWRYLDTGAMYRAITAWMLEHGVDVNDESAVASHSSRPTLHIATDPNVASIHVDDRDVTVEIRSDEVTAAVSAVSAVPDVRARLVALQRDAVTEAKDEGRGIVVEGRDIGTVVLPDADVKIFLTASETERARRRTDELAEQRRVSDSGDVTSTAAAIARRDHADSTRLVSPLSRAEDANTIDATDLSLDEVVARVLELVGHSA